MKTTTKKTVVYISGPITGTDDYMERFGNAQKTLEDMGYAVINPALVNASMPASTTYEQYMKMALAMLDIADVACMLHGWEKSKGARFEYDYAKIMGKPITGLSQFTGGTR